MGTVPSFWTRRSPASGRTKRSGSAQADELARHDVRPRRVRAGAIEAGCAIYIAVLGVESVGELVDDHVVGVGRAPAPLEGDTGAVGAWDIFPGEDDGASGSGAVPRFAEADLVALGDHAAGADGADRGAVAVGVDNDRADAGEDGVFRVGVAVEEQGDGVCGDGDADFVGQFDADAFEGLLGQEDACEIEQATLLANRQGRVPVDVAFDDRLPLGGEWLFEEATPGAGTQAEEIEDWEHGVGSPLGCERERWISVSRRGIVPVRRLSNRQRPSRLAGAGAERRGAQGPDLGFRGR